MYIITKKSRDSAKPYSGPSCARTGILPGRWYDIEEEAIADAAKLSAINPVGFDVQKVDA